jgi:hypothetical protein
MRATRLPGFDAASAEEQQNAYVQSTLLVGSKIGLGTQAPSYPVDIQNSVRGVSLNCAGTVTASEVRVFSDRRIKTAVVEADVEKQLRAVLRLRVSEFAYIDPESHGRGTRTGFVAQQVASVLPACVTPMSEYIPNVMRPLPIVRHVDRAHVVLDVSGAPDGAAASLRAEGTSIRCRVEGTIVAGRVTAAEGDRATVQIDRVPQGAAELFVVGCLVDDFHTLNYEHLCAAAIAALQAQQQRIEAMESQLAKLLAIR